MEISILTHAIISNNKMLQSFSAKIFSAHVALTTVSDIINNSRRMQWRTQEGGVPGVESPPFRTQKQHNFVDINSL